MLDISSLIAVFSVACILISFLMLMNLIQSAFERGGIFWGMVSIIYPPGTYQYCKNDWQQYGHKFVIITALFVTGAILMILQSFQ